MLERVDRIKNQNYMIISIDTEKALDEFQHCFMLMMLKKSGIEKS